MGKDGFNGLKIMSRPAFSKIVFGQFLFRFWIIFSSWAKSARFFIALNDVFKSLTFVWARNSVEYDDRNLNDFNPLCYITYVWTSITENFWHKYKEDAT